MTAATKTTKINGVFCVSNAIGGGMKNAERTKKERDALCGECVSYDLGKPQAWEIVSTWPEDIRREYLKKLYWDYGGSYSEIGDVLGVTTQRVGQLFNELSLPRRGRGGKSAADKANWTAFLSGKRKVKDIIPKETVEDLKALAHNLAEDSSASDMKEELDKRPIVRIRSAFMSDLAVMTDEELARFADFLCDERLEMLHSSSELLDEDRKCASCERIFGKCILDSDFGCPFTFAEWALADGSKESDYELLQRFVTRILKEKADET